MNLLLRICLYIDYPIGPSATDAPPSPAPQQAAARGPGVDLSLSSAVQQGSSGALPGEAGADGLPVGRAGPSSPLKAASTAPPVTQPASPFKTASVLPLVGLLGTAKTGQALTSPAKSTASRSVAGVYQDVFQSSAVPDGVGISLAHAEQEAKIRKGRRAASHGPDVVYSDLTVSLREKVADLKNKFLDQLKEFADDHNLDPAAVNRFALTADIATHSLNAWQAVQRLRSLARDERK